MAANLDELDLGQLLGTIASRKVPEALASFVQLAKRFRLPAPVFAFLPDLASVRTEEEECGRRGIGLVYGKPADPSGAVVNGYDFLCIGTALGTMEADPQRLVLRRVQTAGLCDVYAIDDTRYAALAIEDEAAMGFFQRGGRALGDTFLTSNPADILGTPLQRLRAFRQSGNGAMLNTGAVPTRWDPSDVNGDATGPTDPTNVYAPLGTVGKSVLLVKGVSQDPSASTYPEWRGRIEVPPGWSFLVVHYSPTNHATEMVVEVDVIPDDASVYP